MTTDDPKNLQQAREIIAALKKAAATPAPAAAATESAPATKPIAATPAAKTGTGKALLAVIDSAAKTSFTTSEQASAVLAGIAAAANNLSAEEAQVRGFTSLAGFISRVSAPDGARPFAAMNCISAIVAARRGMIGAPAK